MPACSHNEQHLLRTRLFSFTCLSASNTYTHVHLVSEPYTMVTQMAHSQSTKSHSKFNAWNKPDVYVARTLKAATSSKTEPTSQLPCQYNNCRGFPHPWLLVLEGKLPLGFSDEVVREGSTLHDMVGLCGLPGHSQFDVALELATSVAHSALQLATPIASVAPRK